jgi:chromosomal replication initiator protein
MHRPLTVEVATTALADILSAQPNPPSIPQVLDAVTNFYGVTLEELKGPARSRRVVLPRQIAMYLLREEAKLSFPQIGAELGGRDHSTVMHGYEKIATHIAQDGALRREVLQIKGMLYDRATA